MIKKRIGVFETNSSSSHSLVYSKQNPNRLEHDLEIEDGVLTIHFHEYGWNGPEYEFGFGTKDILASSNDKLDYVMSKLCMWLNWKKDSDGNWIDITLEEAKKLIDDGAIYNIEEVDNLLHQITHFFPEIKQIKFELNVEEYYDKEKDEYREFSNYPFGYIDHQSQSLLDDKNLLNVIFNKGCIIVIDSDNSRYYQAFRDDLKPGRNEGLIAEKSGETYAVYNITEKNFEE